MERVTFNGTLTTRPPISYVSDHLRNRECFRPEPEDDSDISIFDAERYFNESSLEQRRVGNRASPVIGDDLLATCRFSSASSVEIGYGRNYLSRSFHATPTSSSEASWNSQTGLLTYPPGAVSVRLRTADQVKRRGWLFGRKCPCSGNKSVQVENRLSCEPKTPRLRLSFDQSWRSKSNPEITSISQPRLFSETRFHSERVSAPAATGFTFPILGQSVAEESPRDSVESMEVFRPSREGHIFTLPTSPISRLIMAAEDDMGSDASSDLFEIESFSTQTTNYPTTGPGRDSLDEAASLSTGHWGQSLDEPPAECYEPSEASIDWSVTTAEGGSLTNYSASPSEFEEAVVERGGGGGRRRGNVLSSCRCEKAVSVGPQPQPVGKWVSSTKHVGGRAAGQRKPPSGSARLSLALATGPQ